MVTFWTYAGESGTTLIIIAVVKTGVSFLIFDTRGLILTSLDHRIKKSRGN